MDLENATVGQIAITESDVDVALGFYRDVLGLTFLFSPAPNLAFLAAGMPDHELWIAFLRDPDGNLVGLMEEKR